jgi:hypothetical protein
VTNFWEITEEDINRLSAVQLHQLLDRLLHLESDEYRIEDKTIDVTSTIDLPDGGEDGRIKWNHTDLSRTEYLPSKDTFFQCKQRKTASEFSPSQCKEELISEVKKSKRKFVKPRIDELFKNNGTYILFCTFSCSAQMKDDRIKGFREGLRVAGADYSDTCEIQVYDAKKIAEWTNKFIASVKFVCECASKPILLSAKTWNEWESDQDFRNTFYSDATLDNQILQLRKHFSEKQRVARIVGLSGLGKSRLALETFRPPPNNDDPTQLSLSQNVVYIDARHEDNLIKYVYAWRQKGLTGILIVDECDCELHYQLSKVVKHQDSKFSLLTIDYSDDCGIKEDPIFKLKPVDDEIIEKIIKETFLELSKPDVERIVEVSQGFPLMAVLIAKDRVLGSQSIGTISRKAIIDRLIGGRDGPTKEDRVIVTACSLFTHFQMEGGDSKHIEFISRTICGIEPKSFIRAINSVKRERGIIDERGRFYMIRPKPLAITLATTWWSDCSLIEAKQLLLGDEIPKDLINPLCDQFRYLRLDPEIEKLSRELCDDTSPFGQAEILNSVRGSRIFRSIAEVNPLAAVNALYRCFGNADKETIRKIDPARRNLVWALETLCFWEETFPKAARILLKFAVSETELGLGNNATNQFYQLFHYLLSGTKASPELRMQIIKEGLATNDPECLVICITALSHALQSHHFSRSGGVETQGSRYPDRDWQPKTYGELYNYWRSALKILKHYAIREDPIGELSRNQIENSIRGLLRYPILDSIEDVIFSVCDTRGYFWPKVLYELKSFVHYRSNDVPPDALEKINQWIQKFSPKELKDITYVTIIHPERLSSLDGKDPIEEANKQVETFALDLVKKPSDLIEVLRLLYATRSTHGYYFGYSLGKIIENKEQFIDKSIEILKTIPADQRDGSILGGFLFSIRDENSDQVDECLEKISVDTTLNSLLLYLTVQSKPQKRDLSRLINEVKKGTIKVNEFAIFQYGSVLKHLETTIVTEFLSELLSLSSSSCPTVFEITYMYTFNDDKKMQECTPFLKQLLTERKCFFNILKSADYNQHILYSLNEATKKLLQQGEPDQELASQLTKEIINLCLAAPSTFMISHEMGEVIGILLSPKYIETSWPIFGEAIVLKDRTVSFCLKDILGGEASCDSTGYQWNPCLLDKIPLALVSQWCEENRQKAPYFLSEAILPIITINKRKDWSPLALYLLDNYGEDNEVLSGLTQKMHQFSWMGSLIPFYETWLNAFTNLHNHKNRTVKKWTEENIEYLTRMIQETKAEDDELGLYCG